MTGRILAVAAAGLAVARAQQAVVPVVTSVGTFDSYTCYQVSCGFNPGTARDVYALYGDETSSLQLPPAFQVATPFGTNIGRLRMPRAPAYTRARCSCVTLTNCSECRTGPPNAAFYAINPQAQYDSFLTLGIDGPALTPGALSSVGIDFGSWNEDMGIDSANGAVFCELRSSRCSVP